MARDATTQPDVSKLEQISPMQTQLGAPAYRQFPPATNPFLRSPLAPTQWTQPDALRQYYNPESPQSRIAPLLANAQATINSTAKGVATTVVEESTVNTIALQVNGTPNADQALLNLQQGSGITIADKGAGTVTISAGGAGLPLPNSGVFYLARATAGTTSLQTLGDTSTAFANANGTITSATLPTSTVGVAVGITAGILAVGGGYAGWVPNGSGAFGTAAYNFWAGRNCRFQARVVPGVFSPDGVPPAQQNSYISFMGFTQGAPTNFRTCPGTGAAAATTAGFFLASSVTPPPGTANRANWIGAINGNFIDTGVAVVGGALAYVEMIMNDTANTTSFSVNGSTPVVISGANLSGFAFQPTVTLSTQASIQVALGLEYFYGQQDF